MKTNEAVDGGAEKAVTDDEVEKKPLPLWAKAILFYCFLLTAMAVIVTSVFPELMLFSTIMLFLLGVCLMPWGFFVARCYAKKNDDFLTVCGFMLVAVGALMVYNSHDVAQWMSLGLKNTVRATPHAIKEVSMGVWTFLVDFFHHAFFGSPAT